MSFENQRLPEEEKAPMLPPQNLVANVQAARAAREEQTAQEVEVATQALDRADKFEQNAQLVEQEAANSRQAAQDIRTDVNQAEDLRQQQEVADENELIKAQEVEFQNTFVAKREEIANDLAEMTGVEPQLAQQAMGEVLEKRVIDSSLRLNENSEKVQEIKAKIAAAEELSTLDKMITVSAALAPLIAGLATGRVDKGLQASGALLQQFGGQFQARGQAARAELAATEAERKGLEAEQVEAIQGLIDLQGGALERLGKVDKVLAGRINLIGSTFDTVKSKKEAQKAGIAVKKELQELKKSLESKGKTKKLSVDERKAVLFGTRMLSAEEIFTDLEAKNWDPQRLAANVPQEAKSEDRQRFEQAKINFATAILRDLSGAVIGVEEFIRADTQYFPQPGDKPEVLKQKKRNRMDTIATKIIGLEEQVFQAREVSRRLRGGEDTTGRIQELEAELKILKEAK